MEEAELILRYTLGGRRRSPNSLSQSDSSVHPGKRQLYNILFTAYPVFFYKHTVTEARAGISGHKESYAKQLILSTKQSKDDAAEKYISTSHY